MKARSVSHYEVLEQLGAGGMGVVYKARDTRLNRLVALKFLPPAMGRDPDEKKRFTQEARAASALDHPNIGVVYDIDEDSEGQMFIAMAYYEGEPLSRRVGEGIPLNEVVSIAQQLARGLSEAHRHGIVHRDIKPSNVMITRSGEAKIIDFGLAKAEDATATLNKTQGTVAYMSPEQVSGEDIDHRTDLWSFGIVLYEMLAGHVPFDGGTAAVLNGILHKDPPALRSLRPDIPAGLDRVVGRCLERDRERRYASADEIAADLAAESPLAPSPAARKRHIAIAFIAAVLLIAGTWLYQRNSRTRWAYETALPEIARLAEKNDYIAAFGLAEQAEKVIPKDAQLARLFAEISTEISISTTPDGAKVEKKEYSAAEDRWETVGLSPLTKVRVPIAYLRWRFSKSGFAVSNAAFATWGGSQNFNFQLDPEIAVPDGMVQVRRGMYGFNVAELGGVGPYQLNSFFIDKFEVTNRQFQEFVDKGGYRNKDFWKNEFIKGGRTLRWEDAMAEFRDATGRPGPATWQAGRYPEGQDDYPATGVSWFEAAAYAEFAGKSLPTITHWYSAADLGSSRFILPLSNFSSAGPAPVGKYQGIGTHGTYDMAGNVKEWCWNANKGGERFILGGAWHDPAHMFHNNADVRSPFDRSPSNGFRCVKYTGTISQEWLAEKNRQARDYTVEKPVSADAFRAYRSLFTYDRTSLDPKVESVDDTAEWKKEKITINPAYSGTRLIIYVFTPKNSQPPYQPVIYFPGAGAAQTATSEVLHGVSHYPLMVRSGRAVVYPVYWGTYERRTDVAMQRTPAARRERTRNWAQDLSRAIDYMETRKDLDPGKIAYVGHSQGSWVGPVLCQVEDRIKTAIFLDGGLPLNPYPPEVDTINFAPHLTKPVLMINGRYDYTFPYNLSQVPMFRLLGTPAKDKRHVVFETAHDVSVMRNEMSREILDWLDKYLGKVQ